MICLCGRHKDEEEFWALLLSPEDKGLRASHRICPWCYQRIMEMLKHRELK